MEHGQVVLHLIIKALFKVVEVMVVLEQTVTKAAAAAAPQIFGQ
jgi:hypothetical protein